MGSGKIVQVYDPKTGMKGFAVIDNTALGPGKAAYALSLMSLLMRYRDWRAR